MNKQLIFKFGLPKNNISTDDLYWFIQECEVSPADYPDFMMSSDKLQVCPMSDSADLINYIEYANLVYK